jgi:3-oxoadipate enol-lactonase
MKRIPSGDAEIVYEVVGEGPPVLLLHPFPAHRALWMPATQALVHHYRVILPDLRGHGDSGVGEGPATMEKHAMDLIRVLDDAGVGRLAIAGVSIGGYVFFEFWRRYRGRVAGVILCDTKAQADTAEGRGARLKAAAEVMEHGTAPFIESMIPKLLGKTTLSTRPDLVDGARRMMLKMTPAGISAVQKGMAERPDSVGTLKSINVPTLVIVGDEDILANVADAELMRQNIQGSELKVITRAGHYAVWEQPEAVGALVRQFLDSAGAR